MSKKLLIKKILSVSFSKLLYIIWFKIQHRLFILVEKFRLKILASESFYKYKGNLNYNFYSKELFDVFYKFCNKNNEVIKVANDILKNKINLFGGKYTIKETDWLTDPVSKTEWERETFFIDSKIEEKKYGDVKFVMELNKMGFLVSLAHAYYLSSDEKYIKKINDYLEGWIRTVRYEKSVVNKSMLDISFRCLNLIQISLLCFNNKYFEDKVFPVIAGILIASERQIRKFSTHRWTKFSTGANHTIGEMAGLIITQLWLEQFTNKTFEKHYRKQFYYLNRSLDNIITSKGVYLEQSSHYAKLVAEFLVMLDISISAIGKKIPDDIYVKEHLIKLLQYVTTISYNETLPNFGDNDGAKVLYPFYENNYSVSHLLMYFKFINPKANNKKALICTESGQFAWHSKDEKKTYVFIRSGKHSFLPVGSGSHAHNDILSLILSANGKPIFIDFGTYFYNSGIDILNNDRKTSNHNTISIDGVEQALLAGKWMYGSYPQSNFVVDSISVNDTAFKFKGNCSYSNRTHNRIISYASSKFEIIDQIKCEKDDKVKINFLLSPDIRVIKDSNFNISLYREENKIALIQFPGTINLDIVESVYHPSYGIEKKTKKITGFSTISGDQKIITLIYIL